MYLRNHTMYIQTYNAHGWRLSTTHTYAKCDPHTNECTLHVHSMLVHVYLGGLSNDDHRSDPRQVVVFFQREGGSLGHFTGA